MSAKDWNRTGNHKSVSNFEIPKMGNGPSLGNVGTSKLEGGLKKGAAGIPMITSTKKK